MCESFTDVAKAPGGRCVVTPVPPVKVKCYPSAALFCYPGGPEYSNQKEVRRWENDEKTETKNHRQPASFPRGLLERTFFLEPASFPRSLLERTFFLEPGLFSKRPLGKKILSRRPLGKEASVAGGGIVHGRGQQVESGAF